jgi:hypothetical protein
MFNTSDISWKYYFHNPHMAAVAEKDWCEPEGSSFSSHLEENVQKQCMFVCKILIAKNTTKNYCIQVVVSLLCWY